MAWSRPGSEPADVQVGAVPLALLAGHRAVPGPSLRFQALTQRRPSQAPLPLTSLDGLGLGAGQPQVGGCGEPGQEAGEHRGSAVLEG